MALLVLYQRDVHDENDDVFIGAEDGLRSELPLSDCCC